MALTNSEKKELYIRVEIPRVYDKYRVQFDLIQYIDHPVTGEKVEVGRETMECDYDLDGENVFKQCYAHAKKTVEYETIDC